MQEYWIQRRYEVYACIDYKNCLSVMQVYNNIIDAGYCLDRIGE
jgi:hypothetical protein